MTEKVFIQGNELYHFGIPGQKWYRRRFQNEDGTYTEEGKERRRKGSEDYQNYKKLKKKGVQNMSNKELQDYNNRANLERQFKQNNQTIVNQFLNKYKNVVIGGLAGLAGAATIATGKNIFNSLKESGMTISDLMKFSINV